MTYDEELKTIVATIDGGGAELGDISMKFRLSVDETTTYVDLLDNEGVEHFMNLTREMRHIFVSGCPIEDTQLTRDVRRNVQNEGKEDLSTSQRMIMTQESQPLSLSSTIQITLTPRVEMNSTKWKELFIGIGKSFRNAGECRQSVFKYSLAHHFSHKYMKNCNEKIIVRCQAKGCE